MEDLESSFHMSIRNKKTHNSFMTRQRSKNVYGREAPVKVDERLVMVGIYKMFLARFRN